MLAFNAKSTKQEFHNSRMLGLLGYQCFVISTPGVSRYLDIISEKMLCIFE